MGDGGFGHVYNLATNKHLKYETLERNPRRGGLSSLDGALRGVYRSPVTGGANHKSWGKSVLVPPKAPTPHKATRVKPGKGPFLGYAWASTQDKPGGGTTPGLDPGMPDPGCTWVRRKKSHLGKTRQKYLRPVGGQRFSPPPRGRSRRSWTTPVLPGFYGPGLFLGMVALMKSV